MHEGSYRDQRHVPTIREAVDHWLNDRRGNIKPRSFIYYKKVAEYVCGPLLIGTQKERALYT